MKGYSTFCVANVPFRLNHSFCFNTILSYYKIIEYNHISTSYHEVNALVTLNSCLKQVM